MLLLTHKLWFIEAEDFIPSVKFSIAKLAVGSEKAKNKAVSDRK